MKKDKSQDSFSGDTNRGETTPPCVTFNVVPGPTSPAQKHAWRKFWAKLIAEAKRATTEDSSSDGSG